MIVALGGPPGSGKTTAAEGYAQTHGATLVSAGAIFREHARDRNMSLKAYGAYAEAHLEVDKELDDAVITRAVEL